MARLPSVPGLAEFFVHQQMAGRNIVNILRLLNPLLAAWTHSDLLLAATTIANNWQTQVMPLQTSDLTALDVTATDLTSPMGLTVVQPIGSTGGVAPGTSPPLPNSVAMRISFPVAMRYRGGHPGLFIAGLCQHDLAAGSTIQWLSANAQAMANAIFTCTFGTTTPGYTFGAAQVVTVSYFEAHVQRAVPLVLPLGHPEHQPRICSRRKRLGARMLDATP